MQAPLRRRLVASDAGTMCPPLRAALQVVALRKVTPMFNPRIAATALIALTIAGCTEPAPPAPQVRPVRTVTVEGRAAGETVSLTGQVRAKDQVSLAFRLDGRMIERPVNVGDVLAAGQVVARLDPQNQQNALRSAQANLSVGRGDADRGAPHLRAAAGAPEERLDAPCPVRRGAAGAARPLRPRSTPPRRSCASREDQLGYTTLSADAPGAVTAVGAEPGEVVRAGQMIVQLAPSGRARRRLRRARAAHPDRPRATRWWRSPSPTIRR